MRAGKKFMAACVAALVTATNASAASLGVADDRAALEAGTATAWAELGALGMAAESTKRSGDEWSGI